MNYEEKPRKRSKKRRGSFIGGLTKFLLKLILKLILLIAIAGIILYALPVSLFITDGSGSFHASDTLDTDMINILLMGVDRSSSPETDSGIQRSDSMIIISVGYNTLKLTSVMRDTMVDIPGHGRHKLNSAYAYGGPELTVRTINENFGLNITKYIVVDFFGVADIINALGGIDASISEVEQTELNRILKENWRRDFSKRGYDVNSTSLLDLDFSDADENGRVKVRLDGFQALAFARIRKTDSDYMRTSRQRTVINSAITQFKSNWYNPFMLYELTEAVLNNIETNMNIVEILSIGSKALFAGNTGQLRLPVNGTYEDNGSSLGKVNYAANLEAFKEFVYGD